MAVFFFSILILIGFLPAVFFLDRLFAINFAGAAPLRPASKDVFWKPRGFAGKGSETKLDVKRSSFANGVIWLFSAPEKLTKNARIYLILYRVSVLVFLAGIASLAAYFFIV